MPHSSTPATLPSQPHASLHCASRTTEAFTNVIPPPEDVGSTSCTGHPAQGLRCWSHTDLIVGHQLTPHRSQQANWPALPSTRQDYNALYHIATNREGEMPLVFRLLLTPWSSTDASKGIPYQVSPTDINADLRCSISCLGQLHNGTLREGIHQQDSQKGKIRTCQATKTVCTALIASPQGTEYRRVDTSRRSRRGRPPSPRTRMPTSHLPRTPTLPQQRQTQHIPTTPRHHSSLPCDRTSAHHPL